MLKSLLSRSTSHFFKPPYRNLIIQPYPTNEVVIGNFAAPLAVLAAFDKHPPSSHPKLSLFHTPYWMDFVDEGHLNNLWGQTINGLPRIARDICRELFPKRSTTTFLTWGEIQTLRHDVLERLKERGVPIYFGEPTIQRLENGQFNISLQDVLSLRVPKDSRFYLWYKEPAPLTLANGYKPPPNTDLYKIPLDKLPQSICIISVGAGGSTVWLQKILAHLGTARRIVCLCLPGAQLPTLPSNTGVDTSKIVMINIDTAKIRPMANHPGIFSITSPDYAETFVGPIYSSAGMQIPLHVVKDVPPAQLITPPRWDGRPWIAPRNIPMGSLMESISKWFELTNNSWGFELQAYHKSHDFLHRMKVPLDERFYTEWETQLKALPNPVPDEEVTAFMAGIYRKVYCCTMVEEQVFKDELQKWLDENVTKQKADLFEI